MRLAPKSTPLSLAAFVLLAAPGIAPAQQSAIEAAPPAIVESATPQGDLSESLAREARDGAGSSEPAGPDSASAIEAGIQPAPEPAPVVEPAAVAAEPAAPESAAPLGETAAPAQGVAEPGEKSVQPEAETAAAPPPDPVRVALQAAVERMAGEPVARAAPGQTPSAALRREREAVAAFYEARDYAPLWIAGNTFTPAARDVIARLERAREDGLNLGQYEPPTLDAASADAMARSDLALSRAVVGYARQASGGRIEPRSIGLITGRPEVANPQDVLASLAAAADAGEALAAYNPPHEGYRILREKLADMRREHPAIAAPPIGRGRVLRVGMKDPRVPLVRARFGIDAAADRPGGELVYDTRVASAVADFQRANGLPANGVLTARTISLLSGGDPANLQAEILANMELWRWAPRNMGATRIEVNIPDFRARLVRDGKVAHEMRVIVGKPETPTPVFSDVMEYMVVNPSWHIPQSIIRKQLAQDPTYYARNGYEVVRRGNNIFVRQPPGERNALGHVKFMFPNDHAVYMHDTPTRRLFGSSRRAYSHGCVRVDQPFSFAEALAPETGWSEKRLRRLLGKGERSILFSESLPVHIMYFTVFVDQAGKLQTRDDLYGHARKLRAALGV